MEILQSINSYNCLVLNDVIYKYQLFFLKVGAVSLCSIEAHRMELVIDSGAALEGKGSSLVLPLCLKDEFYILIMVTSPVLYVIYRQWQESGLLKKGKFYILK